MTKTNLSHYKMPGNIQDGIPYICGCKLRHTAKDVEENNYVSTKQIYYRQTEKAELFTRKLLSDVADGKYGKEWQQLLLDNPHATIDSCPSLFKCPKCGYWENSEDMSMYLPININEKAKAVNFYVDEKYTQISRYNHICPNCSSVLDKIELQDCAEEVPKFYNEELIFNSHLVCPNCKKEITLLVRGIWNQFRSYYAYRNGNDDTKSIYEWIELEGQEETGCSIVK